MAHPLYSRRRDAAASSEATVRTHGEPDSLVRETDNKQGTENSPLDRSKDLSAKQKTNEAK